MVDRRIQDLPNLSTVSGSDLFVVSRQGAEYDAYNITASQMTIFIEDVAEPYVDDAQAAAKAASQSAENANQSAQSANASKQIAQSAQAAAEEAMTKSETAMDKAKAAQEAAEDARDQAQQIAGGDFVTALDLNEAIDTVMTRIILNDVYATLLTMSEQSLLTSDDDEIRAYKNMY